MLRRHQPCRNLTLCLFVFLYDLFTPVKILKIANADELQVGETRHAGIYFLNLCMRLVFNNSRGKLLRIRLDLLLIGFFPTFLFGIVAESVQNKRSRIFKVSIRRDQLLLEIDCVLSLGTLLKRGCQR